MSLRARILAAVAYVLMLALVVLGVPLALSVAKRVDADVKAKAAAEANLLAASASGQLDIPDSLQALVDQAGQDLDGRVIVTNQVGILIADSSGVDLLGDSYAARPEIRDALSSGRPAQGTRQSETLDTELLYTAVPIVDAGRRVGVVRVTQSIDEVNAAVRDDLLFIGAIASGALLIGLALAWLLAGSLSRPLRALSTTARVIAAGDLDRRAPVSGSPEQRDVAEAFNEMAERLSGVLASQREFVANASHQIRAPLTGLRLRLEAAAANSTDDDVLTELDAAEEETDRLARLLSDLLVLARSDATPDQPATTQLSDAAERAITRWQSAAQSVDLGLELSAPRDTSAHISREDIDVILDNLIENALTYSPPNTSVEISSDVEGPEATVTVADRGPGFLPGEEETVFERFVRGQAGQGTVGTGLGLPVARALARRWGGNVSVSNRDGGGAVVTLSIPATTATSEPLPGPNDHLTRT